jgi:hypothetical protein
VFHELITPNQVTPYIAAVSDLRSGPVVLEVPAKTAKAVLYGQIVDAWQATIADVGPSGVDKGDGGKYLLLPPDYSGPIPNGYFVIRSSGYRIMFAFRSIKLEGATEADAYAYSKTLKQTGRANTSTRRDRIRASHVAVPWVSHALGAGSGCGCR